MSLMRDTGSFKLSITITSVVQRAYFYLKQTALSVDECEGNRGRAGVWRGILRISALDK